MNHFRFRYRLKAYEQASTFHSDGYVDVSGLQPLFTYHLKDHLGNVRIVLQAGGSSGTLKQTNDYYPFGMAYTKNAADSEEESFVHENKVTLRPQASNKNNSQSFSADGSSS